jgi:hypothetical protein
MASNSYTHKHKKEKIIDQYIIKEEGKYIQKLAKKVEHFEKVADIKLGAKRHRDDVAEKNDDKSKEPVAEIPVNQAIQKILKHIQCPTKIMKCLNLLKEIFVRPDLITPIVILKIFDSLLIALSKPNAGSVLSDIYEFMEKSKETLHHNDIYVKHFNEVRNIIGLLVNLLTDDSFKVSFTFNFSLTTRLRSSKKNLIP